MANSYEQIFSFLYVIFLSLDCLLLQLISGASNWVAVCTVYAVRVVYCLSTLHPMIYSSKRVTSNRAELHVVHHGATKKLNYTQTKEPQWAVRTRCFWVKQNWELCLELEFIIRSIQPCTRLLTLDILHVNHSSIVMFVSMDFVDRVVDVWITRFSIISTRLRTCDSVRQP